MSRTLIVKLRPFGMRLLLSACSLLLVALLAEAALRVLYAADNRRGGTLQNRLLRTQAPVDARDRELGFGDIIQASAFRDIVYELKPHLACLFRGRLVETNADGFRDRAYREKKPKDTFRVVGLGDSIMFGWAVQESECYLTVLESWLNALPGAHPRYEVINSAVPGYNTAIEVATFEHKLLRYDPDLVIIQFVSNDFGVPSFMLRKPPPLVWTKSYAWEFLAVRLGRLPRSFEDESLVYREFRNLDEEERANVIDEHRWMVGVGAFHAAMDRLGALTRARGIPVIVIIGTLGEDQRTAVQAAVDRWEFRLLDIAPVTRRVLAREGIPDTREVWRRVGRVSPGDSHPSPFAHMIYAEGLFETMRDMGLAPDVPPPATARLP